MLDYGTETRKIVKFIKETVKEAGAKGAVVGLSGGIDSAVVGALCVRALGKEAVVALLMPSQHTPKPDLEDARSLAAGWGVETYDVNISPVVKAVTQVLDIDAGKIPRANIQARLRMLLLYYLANSKRLLVAGTGDRSEEEIGYFTKYGDGGVDFLPIAHLYKTQVRELGTFLGIPKRVVVKPASPGLWSGHTADEELPVGYEKLDKVLNAILDSRLTPSEAASEAGVSREVVREVMRMRRRSAHKREVPPSLV